MDRQMMNPKLYAELFSDLKEKPEIWSDDGLMKLYIYCVANASHNQYRWRGIQLQPGDLPLSERKTAEALEWSRDKVRRKIRALAELGIIRAESAPHVGTMLHINDWPQNEATNDERLQNSAMSSGELSKKKPSWHHNEAIHEDGTEPWWSQNETGSIGTCFEKIPRRSQNHSSSDQAGLAVRPNPYNKYSSSEGYGMITEPPGFPEVWLSYPKNRRTNREAAAALVNRALNEGATIQMILDALETEKASQEWQNADGQYIPGIVKWLQRESWRTNLNPGQQEAVEDEENWVSW